MLSTHGDNGGKHTGQANKAKGAGSAIEYLEFTKMKRMIISIDVIGRMNEELN